MYHLLFPGNTHPMNIDPAFLDDIKTLRGITGPEKVIVFLQMFGDRKRSNRLDVCGRQPHEELAVPQRILDNRLSEPTRFQWHAGKLTHRRPNRPDKILPSDGRNV